MNPQISIIIPQYKTLQVTKLCLRALRKFSTQNIEVIVVDNNSADESLEYLKKVSWIKLIENIEAPVGGAGHKQALDIGVKASQGKWILLFHSDTVVLKKGWDRDLINLIDAHPAAIGASSVVREINIFSNWASRFYRRIWKERRWAYHHSLDITNEKIMSYCFLIEHDFLLSSGFSFLDEKGDAADALYHNKIKGKRPFILMGRPFLEARLWHTSNVSSILTQQITDSSLVSKFHMKMNRFLSHSDIREVLNDDKLDN